MLKKTITYETFDGEEVTEDFYFHLSKADLVELEMSKKGGLEEWLKRVIASQDGKAIMEEFKNLIMMSVGERSEDGKRFRKDVQLRHNFRDSPAYDVLFMELITNADKAAEFVNGIIPRNLEQQMAQVPKPARSINDVVAAEKVKEGEEETQNIFKTATETRILTRAEAIEMDSDELSSGLATGRYRIEDKIQ